MFHFFMCVEMKLKTGEIEIYKTWSRIGFISLFHGQIDKRKQRKKDYNDAVSVSYCEWINIIFCCLFEIFTAIFEVNLSFFFWWRHHIYTQYITTTTKKSQKKASFLVDKRSKKKKILNFSLFPLTLDKKKKSCYSRLR
jgi:hypothetical protein